MKYTIAVFLLFGVSVFGATYHVSPSGNDDEGNGSISKPWKFISLATSRLTPGDTLFLEGGAVFNQNPTVQTCGETQNPITITSNPDNRAVLTGNGNYEGLKFWNCGGIVLENLVVQGPGRNLTKKDGVAFFTDNKRHQFIRVKNVEVTGYYTGMVFYGWSGEGGSLNGYEDVIVEGSVFHNNLDVGLATWAESTGGIRNFTVKNSVFHNNPGDPELDKNTGSGVVLGACINGLIEYSLAYENGGNGKTVEGPVGIWTYNSDSITIQYCESYGNKAKNMDGGGFDLDQSVSNSIIQYCYSHDNNGAGYLIGAGGPDSSNNNTIRYNISENDGLGGKMGALHFYSQGKGLRNSRIYGNTFFSSVAPAIWYHAGKNMENNEVYNNIFITENGKPLLKGNPPLNKISFKGNAWWAGNDNTNLAGFNSLQEWREGTGQEMLDNMPTGILENPLLQNPGQGKNTVNPENLSDLEQYKLRENSPCHGTGLDLISLFGIDPGERDFFGNSLKDEMQWNIGAHQTRTTSLLWPKLPKIPKAFQNVKKSANNNKDLLGRKKNFRFFQIPKEMIDNIPSSPH